MAISYVGGKVLGFIGTTSVVNVSLTDLTGGSDTAPSAGDFVVVYYGTGSNTTARAITVNSSYTNLTKFGANDTYDANLVVGYKFMGSAPDTSVEVSGTLSTADAGAVVVHVFRGVDQTTPLDVTSVTATGTNSVLCNPGAITPSTAGAWIVAGGAGAHIGGTDTYSSSDLSSFRTVGSNDSYDVTVGAGLKTDWTSGPFDPAAFTWSDSSTTSYSWAAYTLALRPQGPDIAVSVTGVSATGQAGKVRVPDSLTLGYVGGTTLGFAGTTSTTDVSLTSLTGGTDSAPLPGDLVVVYYSAPGAPPITINSGFTNLTRAGDTTSLVVGYKFMGETPDTSVQVSQTFNTACAGTVVVHVFSGANTESPLDVAGTTSFSETTIIINPPAITPVTPGAWIVAGGGSESDEFGGSYSSAGLSYFLSVGANDSIDSISGVGVYTSWTSGSYDPAAFTFSGADNTAYSYAAYTIAIRPWEPSATVDVVVSVTGVTATAAVGTVTVTGTSTTDTTGVSATGQVGEVVATGGTGIDVPVTGVASDGRVGAVTVVAEANALAEATGVSSTGQVGSVAVTATALVQPTGASATGQVGTATASAQIDVVALATGVSALGAVGTITATGTAVSAATGAQASGAVGAVIASIPVTTLATGVSATGAVGDVAILLDQLVLVTGVDAAGFAGELTATGTASIDLTGVSSSGEVGTAIASIPVVAVVGGVAAAAQISAPTVAGGAVVPLLGLQAQAQVKRVFVWGLEQPDPSVWTPGAAQSEIWNAQTAQGETWQKGDAEAADWASRSPSSKNWS
jgi:hypothetical protein